MSESPEEIVPNIVDPEVVAHDEAEEENPCVGYVQSCGTNKSPEDS